MITVKLKPGREKSLKRKHPWVFSGAIDELDEPPGLGGTVTILDYQNSFLAYGAFSPRSQIRIRVWSWDEELDNPEVILTSKIEDAIKCRRKLYSAYSPTDLHNGASTSKNQCESYAQRLIYAESDGIPGLIVDQYGCTLVMQVLSAGIERWKDLIVELLVKETGIKDIYERSDVRSRKLEGLDFRIGPLSGNPNAHQRIVENGLYYDVDIKNGHKTGFYLDQRENRKHIRSVSKGKDVLDCFCYTGGFTLNALVGGAVSVTSIDSSCDSIDAAKKNILLNNQERSKINWIEDDVFRHLRKLRDQSKGFDLIIMDPPKFAQTKSQTQKAARGYKDINLLAFKLLRPDGLLATFSCSGGVDMKLFQKIIADAALDAGVNARIVKRYSQSPDHPVSLNFPEGAYLKGFLLQKDN